MNKKLGSQEFILVKSDENQERQIYLYQNIILYTCTALLVVVAVLGLRALLTESQTSPQETFKLLADRSAASLSLWSTAYGDFQYLSKIDIKFSKDLGNPKVCDEDDLDICIKWLSDNNNKIIGSLQVKEFSRDAEANVTCHEHVVTAPDDQTVTACIALNGDELYGGAITGTQYWPSQKNVKIDSPSVTGIGDGAGIVEPYWLTSSGNGLFVPPDVPLFVSQNGTHLCISSKVQNPYLSDDTGNVSLKYYLCSGDSPVSTHLHVAQNLIKIPRDIPDERMIQHPVWSTWARYKKIIDTAIVTHFADEIIYYGFNNSQLEIDDNWETCYGDLEFYNKTFEDPKALIENLKSKGFRVTIWTHPFINLLCKSHIPAEQNEYFVKNAEMQHTLMTWWDGIGGVINYTNPEAVSWWRDRLVELSKEYDIDAFKYDAGEVSFFPGSPDLGKLNAPIRLQPNIFTTQYVQTVVSVNELKLAEVRVAYNNQDEPMFLRMGDKGSVWGYESGLKSLVTSLLAMNMVGYSYVLPDMVGGNGYGSDLPDKELFIRWLQANTFMPSIQFSYVPWDYDTETVEISKKFTSLHYQYSDKIIELAKKRITDGTPINLPLWWLDPSDKEAQIIDSEFLLGEDLLVAPILDQGATARDIYLPAGNWRDELRSGIIHSGKRWLRNYTVELDELAFFTLVH